MTGLILRCPTCGTSQSHTGECDACYDGQVRYFCGNHSPGLWLDKPTCTECGARFGEAPRRQPSPPAGAAPPKTPRSPRRSGSRPPAPPAEEASRPRRTWPRDREEPTAMPSWASLLRRLLLARRRRIETGDAPWEVAVPEFRLPRLPLVGCLVRLVFLVLLLFALGVVGMFILFSGSVRM